MQITPQVSAASATGDTATTSTSSKDLISYNAFLQLLVAQLKNQDPTKPMDSAQYVSQLSSLSQLEQSVKQTSAINEMYNMSALTAAGSAIGLRATSSDGQTTGMVQSARSDPTGVIATLDSGADLLLGTGVQLQRQ